MLQLDAVFCFCTINAFLTQSFVPLDMRIRETSALHQNNLYAK